MMKTLILIIAGVLGLLLFFSEPRQPAAQGGSGGITCSANGQYVYATFGGGIVKMSHDYGATWQRADIK
jgi:hypothetical protein